ncbi:MAG: mucoidy inhibitor MuiA family protein [Planctomycetota bacterium]
MQTLAFLFFMIPQAQGAANPIVTIVRDVTVYPSEALVTRTGRAAVVRGQNRFEVNDLPVGVRDDSVRVRTSGGPTVVGVDIVASSRAVAASSSVEELRKQRQMKQRARDENADLLKAQDSLRQYIDSLRAEAPKAAGQSIINNSGGGIGIFTEAYAFIGSKLPAVLKEIRNLTDNDAALAAEIADLDRRLEQLQSGRVVPTKTVSLDVTAQKDGETEIEVSYLIGNAGWSAAYDLRAADNLKKVGLAMYGHVVQRTGEDWSNVNLTLSTAKPERGAQPPQLAADYLSIINESPGKKGFAAPAREMLKEDKYKYADSEAQVEASGGLPALSVDAQIVKSGLSTQLLVPRPENVPADGRPHRVRVAESTLDLAPVHFTVPKLATRAFVRSKIKNTAPLPILAGAAQVFVGNDFVGRATLPDVASGEETEIFLGVDPGIKVERKREKADREGPGFLGSRVTWNYSYRFDIKNISAATGKAEVEILENIPVAQDDRIKIEISKSDPPFLRGEKEDRERESQGFLRWKLQLEPGESKTIVLKYSVSAPENLNINGLER